VVLLYDRAFNAVSMGEAWRRRSWYYVSLAGSWVLLVWLVIGTGGRGGTAGFGIAEVTPWTYLLTQCSAIIHYLGLVAWPHPLIFDYGTATVSGLGEVWWQAALLAALVAGTVVMLVRRPKTGFVMAWFFIVLAPSSSIVPVATQTMAEHRVYLALAGPVVLVVWGLGVSLGRRVWMAAAALAVAGGVATVARNTDYATAHGLWADTVAKRPASARAHNNLGLAEQARGQLDAAERHLRDAITLAPGTAEPLYNLGVVLAAKQQPAEAAAAYREAIRIAPESAAAHNNLANLLLAERRSEEAGWHYAEAVRLQPNFAGFRNSYGVWLLDENRPVEAMVQFEEALRLLPQLAEISFNAGNAAAALGRLTTAEKHYRRALQLDPDHAEARNNLGNLLLELERLPEAVAEFEAAVRLRADYFEPRRTLALLLLLHLGRPAEALGHLEHLARMRPADPEITQALASARAASR
jgi:Tfp pilus assembly protein PilF